MSTDRPFSPKEPALEFLAVLGLKPPVSVEDVKQAYIDKAKTAHPDRGGDAQAFMRLHEAFEQATEYARFKAGRMQWLSGWVEQYAEQQELVDEIKSLGIAAGVGAHFPEIIEYCEEHDWGVDFYMASFYNVYKTSEG